MKVVVMAGLIALVSSLNAAVTITEGYSKTRSSSFPKSASGITYAGGSTYYVVADDNSSSPAEVGLYKVTISTSANAKTNTSVSVGSRVPLTGATDLEAVAYDPATGNIWAANETTTKTIKEYDPETGAVISTLDIPSVMLKDRSNFGFESLTISGDGLTMWTANEESLTVDGPRSSKSVASTNRIVKFTREATSAPWRLEAMYPYVTDKWHNQYNLGGSGRRGISDLCALPDGSLLVLERELSSSEEGNGFWAKLDANFYIAIYRITPAAMATATDVKDFAALNAGGWTALTKGSSLVSTSARGFRNWEGLCLGARASGGNCVLQMLTDAGDGNTTAALMPMALSGLDIRTVNLNRPATEDTPSVAGTNYRYLNGAEINVTLEGEGLSPVAYTNRGARVATVSWTAGGRSGTGTTASFTVNGDTQLDWTVNASTASTPIVGSDTFEEYAGGTDVSALAGWSGDGAVAARQYPAPAVGVPMQRATHTKVLEIEDAATREYASTSDARQQLDFMVKVVVPAEDALPNTDLVQGGVVVMADGKFHVVHADGAGNVTTSLASDTVYANGDWVRVTFAFDYTATKPSFTLRINGEYCGRYDSLGSARRIGFMDVTGETALDDVVFTDGAPDFEIAADPAHPSTAPAGLKLPPGWLDREGLAWHAAELDSDGDGLRNWQEYLAGTVPTDPDSTFRITDFAVDGNSVAITFSGELPLPDYLSVKWCSELGGTETALTGTVTKEGDVSVWRATIPAAARFFRAYLP